MVRGRRRSTIRQGDADDPEETLETVEDDEEDAEEVEAPETSIEDLVNQADMNQFDQTFTDASSNLSLQGGFDPVAGDLQVIPRLAYVINFNMVWNPSKDRWEPKKKGRRIDDFEDGDLAEYNITAQDGTIAVQSSTVYEGSFAIEVSSTGGTSRVQSTSGLPNYPEPGQTFAGRHRFNNFESLGGIMFGVQSSTTTTDFYDFDVFPARDEIRFRKNRNPIASKTVQFSSGDEDKWFDFQVQWDTDGTLVGELLEPNGSLRGRVTAQDSTYTDGGVGFRQNADGQSDVRSYWDDVQVIA